MVTGKRGKVGESFSPYDLIVYIVLIVSSLLTVYPLIYVISMSISAADAVLSQRVWLWPIGFSFGSYELVLQNEQVWIAYANTLWYVGVGTAINVVLTICAAYALSRKGFFARDFLMIAIVITMFFTGGIIPLFLQVNRLGLYNTRWSVILPVAVNAWNLIIARTYFSISVPDSLPESAKIDGCTDIGVLVRIVLPTSLPIVAVLTIFYAVFHWNAWFYASIFVREQAMQPLQVFLRRLLLMNQIDLSFQMDDSLERIAYIEQLKYAAIVVATLPILAVYPFFQRYFVKGAMLGAIKE